MQNAGVSRTAKASLASFKWLNASNPLAYSGTGVVGAIALLELVRTLLPSLGAQADACMLRLIREGQAVTFSDSDLLPALVAAKSVIRLAPSMAASAKSYLSIASTLADTDQGPGFQLVKLAMGIHSDPTDLPSYDIPPMFQYNAPAIAENFLNRLEVASRFGTVPCFAPETTRLLLDGAAIAALRVYDLPLGMRFLRARTYLPDPLSLGLEEGLAFLCSLQCADGRFGDFDLAMARMPATHREQMAGKFSTAIGFEALWTIGQIEKPSSAILSQLLSQVSIGYKEESCSA